MVIVSQDEWQAIGFFDIKRGDTLRAVYNYKDGSTSDRIGTVIRIGHLGCWETESGQPVAMTTDVCEFHGVDRHLYRKRKTFTFPTKMGAVIEGNYRNSVKYQKQQFIFDGEQWVRPGGIRDTEEYIQSQFKDLTILSEGVNV